MLARLSASLLLLVLLSVLSAAITLGIHDIVTNKLESSVNEESFISSCS